MEKTQHLLKWCKGSACAKDQRGMQKISEGHKQFMKSTPGLTTSLVSGEILIFLDEGTEAINFGKYEDDLN